MASFKDIPQFTYGSYEVDIHIRHLEKMLKSYEEDYNLELNPDFQRGNVWTEDQQIKFVEFFLRGGKSARVIYFNIGEWSFNKNTDIPQMVCVDGLQRLTAILRFIHGEIPVFGHYIGEYEDNIPLDHTLKFNINNLAYKKDVLKWYLEMNSGGTVHSDAELKRVQKMIEESK